MRGRPDQVTAKVQERVLRRVQVQTPGEFAASVRRAVAKFDTKNQAERHRAAVTKRHVTVEHVDDGMSWINLFLPRDGPEIVWTAIAARAIKTDPADERTADQRRADAIVEIAQAGLANPDLVSQHGIRPTVNITLAATTLAGLDDQPGLINSEPIPAELARRFARHPDARHYYWLVNHSGQVLDRCAVAPRKARRDRGLRTASYTPTARIARQLPARRNAGDHRAMSARAKSRRPPTAVRPQDPPERSERWRRGTRATESQKHRSRWRIRREQDGAYNWTSPTGHTYRYRPPELPVPEPPPPPPTLEEDPPPF